jgi:hypothetical protein
MVDTVDAVENTTKTNFNIAQNILDTMNCISKKNQLIKDKKYAKPKLTGFNRDKLDKFYTKKEIVELCFDYIKDNIEIDVDDLIIEPSAGNGSFIKNISKICNNNLFYDIEPDDKKIIKQDFLTLTNKSILSKLKKKKYKIHIIGNPPFGRQSSIAIKFIQYSMIYIKCNTLSFILPKSFKKDSIKDKIPLDYHCIFEKDLPVNSFMTSDNKNYNVPCIFQIWIKKDIDRTKLKKLQPNQFKFVKKTDNHDFSVRRVGGTAGFIDIKTSDKNIQSHYFIKLNTENTNYINKILTIIKKIKFTSAENTVGPKSISKNELIKEYNISLEGIF